MPWQKGEKVASDVRGGNQDARVGRRGDQESEGTQRDVLVEDGG